MRAYVGLCKPGADPQAATVALATSMVNESQLALDQLADKALADETRDYGYEASWN